MVKLPFDVLVEPPPVAAVPLTVSAPPVGGRVGDKRHTLRRRVPRGVCAGQRVAARRRRAHAPAEARGDVRRGPVHCFVAVRPAGGRDRRELHGRRAGPTGVGEWLREREAAGHAAAVVDGRAGDRGVRRRAERERPECRRRRVVGECPCRSCSRCSRRCRSREARRCRRCRSSASPRRSRTTDSSSRSRSAMSASRSRTSRRRSSCPSPVGSRPRRGAGPRRRRMRFR